MFTKFIRSIYNILGSYLVGGPKGVINHIIYAIKREKPSVQAENPYLYLLKPKYGKIVHKNKDKNTKTLNWFMMDMGTNGGGDINIFRYINGLSNLGFKNNVYISYFCKHNTREDLTKFIKKYYGNVEADFYLPSDIIQPADAAIATEWRTAYVVKQINNVTDKFYFIQDFEPDFFSKSTEYELAKNTYTFGFKGITAGYWLRDKIAEEFGMKTHGFNFTIEDDLYREIKDIKRNKKKIFFYSRPVTPRRAFELGVLALQRLYELDHSVEIVLAGWDQIDYKLNFPHKNLGILKISELPEVYNSCQLGLVLSLTNCSLLPTELLACGCVPVINKGKNNEWLVKDKKNGILVDTNPEDIAKVLKHYLSKPKEVDIIRKNGQKLLTKTTYEEEFKKVADFIKKSI